MKTLESRPYQDRIHDKGIEYFKKSSNGLTKSLLIESPTGSGKTIMGIRLCKYFEEQGLKIGWVAHRRELLHQAEKSNKDFFGLNDIKFISLFNRKPEQFADRDVIVIDECQHDASKSAQILHDSIRPSHIIGLTATPYRTDRAQLCFQKVIKDAGIHQLIREGFLAEFNQWITNNEWTPENVCKTYMERPEEWGKSVIYFLTRDDARECAKMLNAEGIPTGCITGDSPRESLLHAFETGELSVLTNVAVLTEGFDCPNLKTVFVRPSSRGPTVQMAGRVFRKHPDISSVNVVQSSNTKFPFTRHARPRERYVETNNGWRCISSKNLEKIFREQILKISQVKVELPKFLSEQMGGKNVFGDIFGR